MNRSPHLPAGVKPRLRAGLAWLAAVLLPLQTPAAPDLPGQHAKLFQKETRILLRANYLLYLPEQYATSQTRWPLVLFLHGSEERGSNLDKVKMHGPPMLVATGAKRFPFILLSPQCPAGEFWTNTLQIQTLDALLDEVCARFRVDMDRIYVTGMSMGGYGTWRLATEFPDRFAAIAPICGKGEPDKAARIRHIPAWVFHGAKDDAVPLKASEEMVDALKKVGAEVRFTVYPETGHDAWTTTYANPEFYAWLLQHRRKPRSPSATSGNPPFDATKQPLHRLPLPQQE